MNNFLQRGITGFFFVLILISAILWGGFYFQFLFGFIAIFSLQEFYQIFKKSNVSPLAKIGVSFGLVFYVLGVIFIFNQDYLKLLIIAMVILIPLLGFFELYRKKKTPFENIALTIVGIIYTILPFVLLNYLIIDFENESLHQPLLVMSIFILVWTSDTFAYLIGRKIGKHKLFERISPKKSWEGFFGGFVFALIAGFIIAYFFTDNFEYKYIVYAGIISIFGTIGDLVESMLKRSLDIKDSGKILPGHGGLLDRFDAVIFVVPIIFVLEIFFFNA